MTTRLWLVRHGETDWSASGRLNGWRDIELNPVGRDQARRLRGRLVGHEYAGVWSSDLRRAAETARLAYGPPRLDPRLRELDFGSLEGMRWDELSADMQRSLLEFDGFVAPCGDSVGGMRDRVLDFVESLSAGRQLLFTHGGVIRLLLRMADADERVAPGTLVTVPGWAPSRLFGIARRNGFARTGPLRSR